MKAKKSLGQNFLVDNNIINKIVDEVCASEEDLVIEIGPGRGALTSKLKDKKCNLIAYEIDRDLKVFLDKLEDSKVRVIYKDFLDSNVMDDIKNINYNKLYLVGNLPYYITTPIIEHVIDEKINFEKFTIMVQKEVADRFSAKPGNKEYGYITVLLQYYFDIKRVTNVSKYSFNPVPKVESAVLSFTRKENCYKINDEGLFFKLIKDSFRMKRKTLKNNLRDYDFNKVIEILNKYNLNETVRAEELSLEVFIDIANNLV